ncbi:oxygen-independent coproporphyrinogen III oxidase [Endozoicomonas sp. Mp262]|uniref:oxygen-independent coproporphyrinogen III oxidase n=1 Tax=Endozoicomonas sp. Mp262 TaxID=2919499 RepID=UPI0021D9D2B9
MRDAPIWDSELISHYNLSGPRYTSYPTAVQFTEDFDRQSYQSNAWRSAITAKPLSLYFHIPFCTHVCYYCACNKIVTKHKTRSTSYLKHLFREIELQSEFFDIRQPVEQMHFGGGTPTFLSNEQLSALVDKIDQHFGLMRGDSVDYSIELDPREVDWPKMSLLSDLGFNRISIGVQDLNPVVQKAVNRVQSEQQILSVLDAARTMTFKSIHMDLIYGLPHQSTESFSSTLDRIIEMAPDRLSLFNYAHLPHRFKPQRRINPQDLPSAETKLAILEQSIEKLLKRGYTYIGMDHFALPEDDLAIAQDAGTLHRNFQGYTTHSHCDLVGMGVSSISKIGSVYTQNQVDEKAYASCIEQDIIPHYRGLTMSQDDEIRQAIINQLICHFHLDMGKIEQQYQIHFQDYFSREMARVADMQKDGLLLVDDNAQSITIQPKGRLLIRNVCMIFDKYLKKTTDQPLYSKVI